MRRLWDILGKILVIGGWPFLFFYLRTGKRTRLLLVADNSILVVRGWLSSDGKWGLPGGGLHRGEDPAEGVCRELHEETGVRLTPSKLKPLGVFHTGRYGLNFTYYGFTAKLDQPLTPTIKGLEIAEARWVEISRLHKSNAAPDVLDMLARV